MKDPDARFQSGREMWEAMKNHRLAAAGSARASSPAYAGNLPTMRLPPPAALSATAGQHAPARPTGLQTAMAGAIRKTAPPIWRQTEAEPERHTARNFFVVLILLGVIGYTGRRIWPTLKDLWLHFRETSGASATSSPAPAAIPPAASSPTAGPTTAPSVTPAPARPQSIAHQTPPPLPNAGSYSKPEPIVAEPQPTAGKTPVASAPVANSASAPSSMPAPIAAQPKNDSAPAARGTVNVISDPPDATIMVNGVQQIARTPSSLSLAPGTYRIAITKEGYEPYRGQVVVSAGQPARIDTTLDPLPSGDGWVWARSVPKGAEISVDGNPTGQRTPARLNLAAGLHVISFSLAGYKAQAEVDVHAGRGMQLYRVLLEPGAQAQTGAQDQP